ncbi:MAG: ATPase [Flavobacteriales bacterium]|nr:ATPase [Flavobacteriales bacterium]
MILIADSGSTKTDWRLVNETEQVKSFQTIGFNPYYISEQQILDELSKSALTEIKQQVTQVFFYGAGCSSEAKSGEIKQALQQFFTKATIEVDHDLLAAARSLSGNKAGLVAILGTGSNTCFFDGTTIVKNVSSLGFILGDEGSGAHLGKTLVTAYLNNELTEDLHQAFQQKYQLTLLDILDAVYKKPLPNRFLAQFAPFVLEHKQHPQIAAIINACFSQFFEKHICKYENYQQYPLNMVGSIGFVFKNEIEQLATHFGVNMGIVIKQPIDGLVKFHT